MKLLKEIGYQKKTIKDTFEVIRKYKPDNNLKEIEKNARGRDDKDKGTSNLDIEGDISLIDK